MSQARVIAVVMICQVLVFSGIFAFPALAPTFIDQWRLTYTEAGWISGIYFAGYVTSVTSLVRLTERIDARVIFAASAVLISAAWFGFSFLAEGFWSGLVFRFLGGVGLAGTYMPGLRMFLDRVPAQRNRLVIMLYMASGALGHSMSFLIAGEVGARFGWQAVFLVTGTTALIALALVLFMLPAVARPPHPTTSAITGLLGVWRNRPALGFVLAYSAHNWEVYTLTAWVVALLTFNLSAGGLADPWIAPSTVGTVIGILAIPAILTGGVLSTRFGDRAVVTRIMLVSAAICCAVGAAATASYDILVVLLMAYTFVLYGDSAGLTSGAIASAGPGQTADVMAAQTLIGHFAAAAGPPVFGLVLDRTGGGTGAWIAAFFSLAVVVLLGPACLRWSVSGRTAG